MPTRAICSHVKFFAVAVITSPPLISARSQTFPRESFDLRNGHQQSFPKSDCFNAASLRRPERRVITNVEARRYQLQRFRSLFHVRSYGSACLQPLLIGIFSRTKAA